MPLKRKYVFQVEVEFTGPERDFRWFFNPRRSKMAWKAKELSKTTEALSEKENKPKNDENRAKKFIARCAKLAGLNLVKNHWYHEDRSKLPAHPATISKNGQSFNLQAADYGYARMNIKYHGANLSYSYKMYKTTHGGMGVDEMDKCDIFNIDKADSESRLVETIKNVFFRDMGSDDDD